MSQDAENTHKKGWFVCFAQNAAAATGSPWAFGLAVAVVVLWIVAGPLFNFSDTWQLVINTGTTIITFLMVFLIQNTQNRDARIMQLKLDELIRTASKANTAYIDMENMSETELAELQKHYGALAKRSEGGGRSQDRRGPFESRCQGFAGVGVRVPGVLRVVDEQKRFVTPASAHVVAPIQALQMRFERMVF